MTARICLTVAAAALVAVLATFLIGPAHGQAVPSISEWFGSLKMPNSNTSCCDISDGFRTDARIGPEGWEAKNRKGEWIKIPEDRIVRPPTNPTGSAVLFMPTTSDSVIYCFIPPIEA